MKARPGDRLGSRWSHSFFVVDNEGEGGIGFIDWGGVTVRAHVHNVSVVVAFGAYDAKYFVGVGSLRLSSLDSDEGSCGERNGGLYAVSGGGGGVFVVSDRG